jgi:hypothetical protein
VAGEKGSNDGASSEGREERLAKNEAFFRETNEQLERDGSDPDSTFDCICECSRRGCVQRIEISRGEYERVRADSRHFVVANGHEDISIEVVVERLPNYLVVEKHGDAGDVARQTDPRSARS